MFVVHPLPAYMHARVENNDVNNTLVIFIFMIKMERRGAFKRNNRYDEEAVDLEYFTNWEKRQCNQVHAMRFLYDSIEGPTAELIKKISVCSLSRYL